MFICGVLIAVTAFQGAMTGNSGFRWASLRFLKKSVQLSNLASLPLASICSFGVYFGWNCFM